mmetsp:Transcript_52802/g.106014  ORF Transcript_52802/g.106014 Transcript_52802/m.106014 type:complete len:322 (-) Transcript_52802:99-1064(-)
MTLWPFQQVICHSEPFTRSFVAPRCSAAYCLHLLSLALLVLVPLYAGLAFDHIWIRESSYREQPLVSFTHELVVALSPGALGEAVGWSSRTDFEPLLPGQLKVPSVRSTPRDRNDDGVPDTWELILRMPVGNVSKGFEHVFLLAAYDFELRQKVAEKIGGLVVIDVRNPSPATGVWLRGDLKLRQTAPLRLSSIIRDVYARNPLALQWESNEAIGHHPLTLQSLIKPYAAQNETVYLHTVLPPAWDYSPRDFFEVHVVCDVPPQLVYYVPGTMEVLRFAWVQFLSLGIPTWAILRCVKAFAYDNQIVESYVVAGLPPKDAM